MGLSQNADVVRIRTRCERTRPEQAQKGFDAMMNGSLYTVLTGDCLATLPTIPDGSVQCCVTSPPYWGLRDYGVGEQIGLEKTPVDYVTNLVTIFAEVRRVLKNDGTLWLNLGDSYAGGGNYRGVDSMETLTSKQASNRGARGLSQALGAAGKDSGLLPKQLCGIPWRVAFALQAADWYLRSDIIWAKPNPMPESVTDRCTKSHEYLFLLTKSARYYYDALAIAEPLVESSLKRYQHAVDNNEQFDPSRHKHTNGVQSPMELLTRAAAGVLERGTRNRRSVWTVPTDPYSEAHFATFPPDLIKPCILAGSKPGDVILDPFAGSGTTGQVAIELGRKAILCELNPEYVKLIHKRCHTTPGLPLETL